MRELRNEIVPQTFAGTQAEVLVGGTSSENIDYFDSVIDPAPVGDRVRAAPDLRPAHRRLPLDRRRRHGRGAQPALGRRRLRAARARLPGGTSAPTSSASSRTDAIEAWVPLFLFSVLFGLSMDYQVFLLSRIRERYDQISRHDGRGHLRRRLDRAHHHRRGADHRRRLLRLRPRRPDHVPADGLRRRDRAPDRRDDHPLRAPPQRDEAARRLELVPARAGSNGCRSFRSSVQVRLPPRPRPSATEPDP